MSVCARVVVVLDTSSGIDVGALKVVVLRLLTHHFFQTINLVSSTTPRFKWGVKFFNSSSSQPRSVSTSKITGFQELSVDSFEKFCEELESRCTSQRSFNKGCQFVSWAENINKVLQEVTTDFQWDQPTCITPVKSRRGSLPEEKEDNKVYVCTGCPQDLDGASPRKVLQSLVSSLLREQLCRHLGVQLNIVDTNDSGGGTDTLSEALHLIKGNLLSGFKLLLGNYDDDVVDRSALLIPSRALFYDVPNRDTLRRTITISLPPEQNILCEIKSKDAFPSVLRTIGAVSLKEIYQQNLQRGRPSCVCESNTPWWNALLRGLQRHNKVLVLRSKEDVFLLSPLSLQSASLTALDISSIDDSIPQEPSSSPKSEFKQALDEEATHRNNSVFDVKMIESWCAPHIKLCNSRSSRRRCSSLWRVLQSACISKLSEVPESSTTEGSEMIECQNLSDLLSRIQTLRDDCILTNGNELATARALVDALRVAREREEPTEVESSFQERILHPCSSLKDKYTDETHLLRALRLQVLLGLEWCSCETSPNETIQSVVVDTLRVVGLRGGAPTLHTFLQEVILPTYRYSISEVLGAIYEELDVPLPGGSVSPCFTDASSSSLPSLASHHSSVSSVQSFEGRPKRTTLTRNPSLVELQKKRQIQIPAKTKRRSALVDVPLRPVRRSLLSQIAPSAEKKSASSRKGSSEGSDILAAATPSFKGPKKSDGTTVVEESPDDKHNGSTCSVALTRRSSFYQGGEKNRSRACHRGESQLLADRLRGGGGYLGAIRREVQLLANNGSINNEAQVIASTTPLKEKATKKSVVTPRRAIRRNLQYNLDQAEALQSPLRRALPPAADASHKTPVKHPDSKVSTPNPKLSTPKGTPFKMVSFDLMATPKRTPKSSGEKLKSILKSPKSVPSIEKRSPNMFLSPDKVITVDRYTLTPKSECYSLTPKRGRGTPTPKRDCCTLTPKSDCGTPNPKRRRSVDDDNASNHSFPFTLSEHSPRESLSNESMDTCGASSPDSLSTVGTPNFRGSPVVTPVESKFGNVLKGNNCSLDSVPKKMDEKPEMLTRSAKRGLAFNCESSSTSQENTEFFPMADEDELEKRRSRKRGKKNRRKTKRFCPPASDDSSCDAPDLRAAFPSKTTPPTPMSILHITTSPLLMVPKLKLRRCPSSKKKAKALYKVVSDVDH